MQTHIRCERVAPYVLLPGDPARAQRIAGYFDESQKIAQNREFLTYTGKVGSVPVSVTSTGIGCPSTAIAAEELIACGASTLIRVGTCGALQPSIAQGDIVIATGAVRDEGTTPQYVPLRYPAIADYEVTKALIDAASQLGARYHFGIVHTKDAFYMELGATPEAAQEIEQLRRSGILATEMECSSLFVISQLRRIRAGGVLAVVGPVGAIADPTAGVDLAIRVGVEAIKLLAERGI